MREICIFFLPIVVNLCVFVMCVTRLFLQNIFLSFFLAFLNFYLVKFTIHKIHPNFYVFFLLIFNPFGDEKFCKLNNFLNIT